MSMFESSNPGHLDISCSSRHIELSGKQHVYLDLIVSCLFSSPSFQVELEMESDDMDAAAGALLYHTFHKDTDVSAACSTCTNP